MSREEVERLIDIDMQDAFRVLDNLNWGKHYGTYMDMKKEWVTSSPAFSRPDFRERLKTLLSLNFDLKFRSVFPNTHLLTPPPFTSDYFLGREDDLETIYHKFFLDDNSLLLINGQGGIGKTTLAAKYWERYKSYYSHVAWVFAGDDLTKALLTIAPELNLVFPDNISNTNRLPLLLQKLDGLEKPCLLVIDNANNPDELKNHYLYLRSFSKFHILLTSRIAKFEQIPVYRVQHLKSDPALQLFERYYPIYRKKEQALLLQILKVVDYNTLIIQILAKSLSNLNELDEKYSLSQLLDDLKKKGVLGTNQGKPIMIEYQATDRVLRKATPEEIIETMYDLRELKKTDKHLLSIFAILPAERIDMMILAKLLPNTEIHQPLISLSSRGWLDIERQEHNSFFKISPVVQDIVRKKQKLHRGAIQDLVSSLLTLLKREGYNHFRDYKEAAILSRFASGLLDLFSDKDRDIANLYERVGKYYEITGNLHLALDYFQKYYNLFELLANLNNQPDNTNGLAIACERLGDAYLAINNLDLSLDYYEQYNTHEQYLNKLYPDNPLYQNNLAISYSKLGDVWIVLAGAGVLDERAILKALEYYDKDLTLIQSLHSKDPHNAMYQNSLAISFSRLGNAERALGLKENLAKALDYYLQAHQIFESLKFSNPENVDYQNGLATSFGTLGDTYRFLNNTHDALKNYEQSHEIVQSLKLSFPDNLVYQNRLALSYARLGDVHQICGFLDKALYNFEQELQLFQSLQSLYPDSDFRYNILSAYARLEEIHRDLGNLAQSQEYGKQIQEFNDSLESTPPNKIAYQNGLGISYSRLGELE